MPNIRWLLALITSLHRWLYRATRGVIGHRIPILDWRSLLLTHVGRKTGRGTMQRTRADGLSVNRVQQPFNGQRYGLWPGGDQLVRSTGEFDPHGPYMSEVQ